MSDKTGIAWTDATWNPTRGCSLVSAGCTNCYAMRFAHRWPTYNGLTKSTSHGQVWTGEVRTVPAMLDQPLRWKRPRRIFVNSMSDLFHEDVPDSFICAVFAVMEIAQRHTFQILTKRPARMLKLLSHPHFYAGYVRKAGYDILGPKSYIPVNPGWPMPNVWLGVSVEDQATANERIPLLLQTPATVRYISYEPALSPIDLEEIAVPDHAAGKYAGHGYTFNALRRVADMTMFDAHAHIDWVIVGGESGPKARPFDIAWARKIIRQCGDNEVACFVKQLGARPFDSSKLPSETCGHSVCEQSATRLKLHDRAGGDPAEWPADLRVRQFPGVAQEPTG